MEAVLSRSVYRMESSLAEGCQLDSEGQSYHQCLLNTNSGQRHNAYNIIEEHMCGCDTSSIVRGLNFWNGSDNSRTQTGANQTQFERF